MAAVHRACGDELLCCAVLWDVGYVNWRPWKWGWVLCVACRDGSVPGCQQLLTSQCVRCLLQVRLRASRRWMRAIRGVTREAVEARVQQQVRPVGLYTGGPA